MTDRADQRAEQIRRCASEPSDADGAAFADLVCADPVLLRLEFDAIIAANYPPGAGALRPRPPRTAVAAATGFGPSASDTHAPSVARAARPGPRRGRHPRPRQRAPPEA